MRNAARRVLRSAFERLPVGPRQEIKRRRSALVGFAQLKRNQAMLARRIAELEVATGALAIERTTVVDERFAGSITSRVCTQAQLGEAWYRKWCAALGQEVSANRKLWEHAYIAHVLDSLGQLRPGGAGLGFGVGREPLVALFAGRGCRILATDLPDEAEEVKTWANTAQYAGDLASLLRPGLCDPAKFHDLVTWRPVDMRSVPDDLSGFDFCWSACSLEHLGSLDKGMQFVERSLASLRPGGIAVHTTEYNAGSNDATLTSGHTVLYRRRDLEDLVRRLKAAHHEVAALELDPGVGALDEYVDLPPYVEDAHLRLLYKSYITTSVALVIRARS